MKLRTILAIGLVVVFTACGSPYRATTTTVQVAPNSTRTAFIAQYPSANNVVWMRYDAATVPIDWELAGWPTIDNNAYLVRFDQDNNNYYAWYDASGNWIGTSYAIADYNTMPLAVNTTITNKFPGYTITSVNREFQHDRVAYEVQLTNTDSRKKVLIDAYGNVLKEKTRALE